MTYDDHPALRISRLLEMEKSPEQYRYSLEQSDGQDTESKSQGRLIHLALWEPDAYSSTVVAAPMKRDQRTKAYKDFVAEHAGKQIITKSEHKMAMSVVSKLATHKETSKWIGLMNEFEVPVYWKHRSGRECKSKFDATNVESRVIVDLKTTKDCSVWAFARSCAHFDYHTRAAFYCDAFEARYGNTPDFVLIAAERVPPFSVACYTLPSDAIESGRAKYERLMGELSKCELANKWPGPNGDETVELNLPSHIYNELDSALDIGGELVSI